MCACSCACVCVCVGGGGGGGGGGVVLVSTWCEQACPLPLPAAHCCLLSTAVAVCAGPPPTVSDYCLLLGTKAATRLLPTAACCPLLHTAVGTTVFAQCYCLLPFACLPELPQCCQPSTVPAGVTYARILQGVTYNFVLGHLSGKTGLAYAYDTWYACVNVLHARIVCLHVCDLLVARWESYRAPSPPG